MPLNTNRLPCPAFPTTKTIAQQAQAQGHIKALFAVVHMHEKIFSEPVEFSWKSEANILDLCYRGMKEKYLR